MNDIEFCRNNSVLAIRPAEGGRWNELISRTAAGEQQVWVFSDAKPYKDAAGNERPDFLTLGVMHGPLKDGLCLIADSSEAGLAVGEVDFFVPFSNGKSVEAQTAENVRIWAYTEDEYQLRRLDDPPAGERLLEYCAT